MTTLLVLITAVLASNGLLLTYLNWAFQSPRFAPHRMRAQAINLKVSSRAQTLNSNLNGLVSLAMVYAAVLLGYDLWFVDSGFEWFSVLWQSVAVLGLYDLFYYFLHRSAHRRRKLMKVHGVHHQALYPSARESLWIHPLETVAGIGLLLSCTWLVGPVNIYAFACLFLVYTSSNLLIHSGITFPGSHPFRVFNTIAKQHYGHHMLNMKRNYAPLTTIWDRLFGTSL